MMKAIHRSARFCKKHGGNQPGDDRPRLESIQLLQHCVQIVCPFRSVLCFSFRLSVKNVFGRLRLSKRNKVFL